MLGALVGAMFATGLSLAIWAVCQAEPERSQALAIAASVGSGALVLDAILHLAKRRRRPQ